MSKEFDWSQFEEVTAPTEEFNWDNFEELLPAQGIGPEEYPLAAAGLSPLEEFQKSIGYTIPKGQTFGELGESIGDLGQGFRHGVEGLTHGVAKWLTSFLPGGTPQRLTNYSRERLQDYLQAAQRSPIAAGIGDLIGSLGVRAPIYAALGAPSGILPGTIQGGLTEGALGFLRQPEDEKSRLYNALIEGGRGAVLGGAFGGIKALPSAYKAYKNNGVSNALHDAFLGENKNLAQASKIYNNIGKEIKGAGQADNLKIHSNMQWDALEKYIPEFGETTGKQKLPGLREIKRLVDKGDYESIDAAQSMIGKWKRALESRGKAGALNVEGINALKNAERKLHGSLARRFGEFRPELGDQYQKANELYAKGINEYNKSTEMFRRVLEKALVSSLGVGVPAGVVINAITGKK